VIELRTLSRTKPRPLSYPLIEALVLGFCKGMSPKPGPHFTCKSNQFIVIAQRTRTDLGETARKYPFRVQLLAMPDESRSADVEKLLVDEKPSRTASRLS
jgi:hypothetical protein